ncbi:MAG: GntR family transcriptional regulator [Thermincola sp.]|nr:GntR family transcriptional regulator [Thermincola sp.]
MSEGMLQLDFRSRVPVYEQLTEKIKEQIVYGVLKEDEQLPSVRELALELTINPNTIQKAYRELERQGYIYSVPGKGNFVKPMAKTENTKQKQELMAQLRKVIAELLYLGITVEELREIVEKTGNRGGAK